MYFNGRFVLNLAQIASHQGADMQRLIALSGKSAEDLCQEDCRIGPEAYNSVVEEAVLLTEDSYFGLHAGENLNLQAAGLIVQIAQTSQTVRQALEYCCEFANLGCNALPTSLVEEPDYYKLTLTPEPSWWRQSPTSVLHTVYGYLAFTIREFQSLTRNKYYPMEVWLAARPSTNIEELHRVLNCPVYFNKEEFAILFSKDHVEEQVVTSDYALLQVLVSHAQSKLEELSHGHGFYSTVRRSIINLVKPDFPTIEKVAGHLNLSVRTFQRKLKAEGHSFKDLIDELREDFAKGYLRNKELSISEIAYLLNYADASTFIRSFKRWTGTTPKEYRQSAFV